MNEMYDGFSKALYLYFPQAFEEDMKQKHEQLQKLREKLLHLIEKHPDSPEAAKWKQMLAQIGMQYAASHLFVSKCFNIYCINAESFTRGQSSPVNRSPFSKAS